MYAATCAISEATGLKSLGKDFGEDLRPVAQVDAQAAIGLYFISGLGKARHVEAIVET